MVLNAQHPRNFFFALAIATIFISPLFSVSPSSTSDTSDIIISIDCSRTDDTIASYAEINCGPLPNPYTRNGVDITKQYREIGIDFIRTHDFYGPTDISNIFPNWSADPEDEASYNFTASDEIISAIVNAGCRVFYRLGESASDNESLRQPPKNFSKWAEVCKHVVMHYNDGWANGYHYNITYWEIWNEPDLSGFWNGTAEQYYKLYEITAKTLKSYNSSLKIGGPCTSSVTNENFTTRFLEYVTENNVPLDFFSWHMYAKHPYELYRASLYIRNMLDRYGFTECENINTEWNINILGPQRDKDNAKNAAFTACTLIAFKDAGIDYAFRYRGTQDNSWLARLLGLDLSLFTYDGMYKTPALAYLAMHYMVKDTPIRLFIPPVNVSTGIAYLAGISEDKSNISILISNYEASNTNYILNITNIPWNGPYKVVYYLIDDSHHLEIFDNITANTSSYVIERTIERNTVHFIRLTNSTIFPDEGPEVANIPFILKLRCLDPIIRILAILLLILIFG